MSTPFFMTHHAPVGAWTSLTFGNPKQPVGIEVQDPGLKATGTMLCGFASAAGIQSLGFTDMWQDEPQSLRAEGDKEHPPARRPSLLAAYHLAEPETITRDLTAARDRFTSGKITLVAWTPCGGLTDPRQGEIPALECMPAILLDVEIDNRQGTAPGTAFFGFLCPDMKRVYASQRDQTARIAYRNDWAFTAHGADVFALRGLDAPALLMRGRPFVHENGPCFLCCPVAAGERRTLTVAFSSYAETGSNGALETRYYYRRYFTSAVQAGMAALSMALRIRERSMAADQRLAEAVANPQQRALLCQSIRAYYASTQLLVEENGTIHWSVAEGAYLWRNTMDLCADHIVWELQAHPWVVRSLMEDFLNLYHYHDRVTFAGREGTYPGGISFTHDMGCFFTYADPGSSAYERANDTERGFYFYMTTEELLNGIYCLAGYTLHTRDTAWLRAHPDILAELMTSLENRDAPSDDERNGILKAVSCRSGLCGLESTTYDALDRSLLEASSSLYVFVKTWCALLLLKACCQRAEDTETLRRADQMLARCRASLRLFQTEAHSWLKANACQEIDSAVIAAIEALAVPSLLGVLHESAEPQLFDALRTHAKACLRKGVCVDAASGGLRLSSTSKNTWPSKCVLTLYVLQEVLRIEVPASILEEIVRWCQESAKEVTIADQIMSDTRQAIGGPYYPRIVTTAAWLWPIYGTFPKRKR